MSQAMHFTNDKAFGEGNRCRNSRRSKGSFVPEKAFGAR